MLVAYSVNGTSRSYVLFVPNGYDANKSIPLIFAWHSSGADGAESRRYYNLEPVTGDDLERVLRPVWQEGDRLLVRTDYLYNNWGRPDYWDVPPYLTPSAAEWAIDNGASLFGLDCLTERPGDAESPVHHALLAAGIPLLEYVTNMHELTKQVVQLVALPMKAAGAEAAPTRVIAMEDTDG